MQTAHYSACGYAYVIVDPDGSTYKRSSDEKENGVSVYRGQDAAKNFIDEFFKIKEFQEKLMTIAPMQLSEEEKKSYKNAKECYICKMALEENRVRDHCHISSNYRGTAHPFCNLNFKQSKIIPVVFHN